MSARPRIPPDDAVSVEIDGRALSARKGAMIIEVADKAGIAIPRFCYHSKLSIAANCRMCLVEVEKVPKPVPACATPVMDGMKVYTKSDRARSAQKAVMEFLLINHPLDCPICDQGGECELQDLALGYGRDVSRFAEKKRVVRDKDVGPLIATYMTRCIHCTRCIRMLHEIAGKMELGATGRGENMEIGTYIEHSIESELSGNVIDVCPVGALTSKPFRFVARSWEMTQHPSVAPHDCAGSNLYVHTRRGRVMRVVPRDNEAINEVWLSDRDRFSYLGLYTEDRLRNPMRKLDGQWQECDWDIALDAACDGLRDVIASHGADELGILASPAATLEEMFLMHSLAESLGIHNIDHRLRQADFCDQERAPLFPGLGQEIAELEGLQAALLIGSNVRKEQPIIALRLRKAALAGARIMCVNPVDYEFNFPVHGRFVSPPAQMAGALAGIAASLEEGKGEALAGPVRELIAATNLTPEHQAMAQALGEAESAAILLGSVCVSHPAYSLLKALAGLIAARSGARLGYLPEAANSVGGWLAGVLPHRGPGGVRRTHAGLDARAMLESPRKAYLLFGVEPEFDCQDQRGARAALEGADFVVSLATHTSGAGLEYADVYLPVTPYTETSGTFVNAEGRWQGFVASAAPYGASRPGWKVLRVLGNRLGARGFEFASSEEIRDTLRDVVGTPATDNLTRSGPVASPGAGRGVERVGDVPAYAVDALVRRSSALQQTIDGAPPVVRICTAQAERLGLVGASRVRVRQGEGDTILPLLIDDRVPPGCVWLPSGTAVTVELGPAFGAIHLERAAETD
jgi:NADH-quinone oxidoreductase subunit G